MLTPNQLLAMQEIAKTFAIYLLTPKQCEQLIEAYKSVPTELQRQCSKCSNASLIWERSSGYSGYKCPCCDHWHYECEGKVEVDKE